MIQNFQIDSYLDDIIKIIINCPQNVLLHGPGGTGKTAIINKLYNKYKNKYTIIKLATTGAAARNIDGNTIHKVFRLKAEFQFPYDSNFNYNPTIRHAEIIIIDEISMLSSDLLDSVDRYLKWIMGNKEPFGGKKMIFVGDLLQLPPVVTKNMKDLYSKFYNGAFLFNCNAFRFGNIQRFELNRILRQSNVNDQMVLNLFRTGNVDHNIIEYINRRYINLNYNNIAGVEFLKNSMILCPTKNLAQQYNKIYMGQLTGKEATYPAYISGYYPYDQFPTEQNLVLKVGCNVMITRNDPQLRYTNGSIGTILDLYNDKVVVAVNGFEVQLNRVSWEYKEPRYDEIHKHFSLDICGKFVQFPCILCSGVTMHRVQGATFQSVLIDKGNGFFESGQLYVGLSRCKSLDKLYLAKKLELNDVKVNQEVINFLNSTPYVQL